MCLLLWQHRVLLTTTSAACSAILADVAVAFPLPRNQWLTVNHMPNVSAVSACCGNDALAINCHAAAEYVDGPMNLYGLEGQVDVMIESKAKELALLEYRYTRSRPG